MATVNIGSLKFNWKGTYNGSTAYAIDDVTEYNGSSYICILASTGNLPTNTTYFQPMATKGTDGTDVGTTLTTQGDILYRDGSGLQRLPKGTAGQVLKMNAGATAPEYGTGGGVLQTVFTTTQTRFSSTSNSFVATPLTVTITPTSSSSKIVLFLRTLTNVTGDSYPRFAWFRRIGSGSFSQITADPSSPNGGSTTGAYLADRANPTNIDQMNVMSDVYQDYPNTTSAVTYTLYGVRENGGTFYINTSEHYEGGGTADYDQVGQSNILAMETGV